MKEVSIVYFKDGFTRQLTITASKGVIQAKMSAPGREEGVTPEFPKWFERFLAQRVEPEIDQTVHFVNLIRLCRAAGDVVRMLGEQDLFGVVKPITNWPEDWPDPKYWGKEKRKDEIIWDENFQVGRVLQIS